MNTLLPALASVALLAAPLAAQAAPPAFGGHVSGGAGVGASHAAPAFGGHGGYRGGYRGGYYGYYPGAYALGGFGLGLAAGAAFASPYYYGGGYYSPPYAYEYDYDYDYGPDAYYGQDPRCGHWIWNAARGHYDWLVTRC